MWFTWICKNLSFIVMDMIFIFMSMIFIFMFMFMRFLFIFIFMTLIFIFKTIHEVQVHIHVIFMLMHIHIHGNSWGCTRNSHELYEPWTVMSCMNCNAWKIYRGNPLKICPTSKNSKSIYKPIRKSKSKMYEISINLFHLSFISKK